MENVFFSHLKIHFFEKNEMLFYQILLDSNDRKGIKSIAIKTSDYNQNKKNNFHCWESIGGQNLIQNHWIWSTNIMIFHQILQNPCYDISSTGGRLITSRYARTIYSSSLFDSAQLPRAPATLRYRNRRGKWAPYRDFRVPAREPPYHRGLGYEEDY